MPERLPRLFGKYVLLKSLARGGMGEIYLAATDQGGGLAKLCVIKTIIAEKTDRAKVNRFLDEAKVVLRLSHANLVPTFDAGDVGGELFIAMELVEGKDLREIWNRCVKTRTRIPLDVALQVVRETARALAYVHGYGELRLVHRDVAPPNMLLSYYGEVKLTDFGLARSALKQEHTAPGVVFGRASYLAPEQARGEVADGRTDIYSLGIVLWELLTGQPYLQLSGLDPVTSLALVRNPKAIAPSTQAPWIPPELDEIVLRSLAPDRTKRFQSAEELRRALSDLMARIAPRADAERVAEFMRGLYQEIRQEERAERDRFLTEILPRWRGEVPSASPTPTTNVVPIVAAARAARAGLAPEAGVGPAAAASSAAASSSSPRVRLDSSEGAALRPAVSRPAPEPVHDTVVTRMVESAGETLHASAMRVRNVSVGKRPTPADASGIETKVWRRRRRGAPVPEPDPDAEPVGSEARSGPTATEPVSEDASDDRSDLESTAEGPAGAGSSQTFVGRIIEGRYRIRGRIGEGGMGTVYKAEHVEIGKSVAVKILRRRYSGDKQLVERFRREARAASRVGHPHITDVTDFGTTEDGCAYFVMEYLEGMDLADVLAHEGTLEPARVMRIAVQICRALGAAHAAGIIHRDLKPENVFLVARGGQTDFVKVLDFGIARNTSPEASRLTNPGMTMGTPEYMSPEQVLGRPADPRTDVYALGALMYEMLLGCPPFRATTGDSMLDQKMRPLASLREQRPDIPPGLDAVVARAMAPDAARRPQTMAALEYELTKVLSGRAQAVTDLLGLRELSAGHGETPALNSEPIPAVVVRSSSGALAVAAAVGPPAASPAANPRPALSLVPAPTPARMRSEETEAFLEADLSPQPQLTAPAAAATAIAVAAAAGAGMPRRSASARPAVATSNGLGAPAVAAASAVAVPAAEPAPGRNSVGPIVGAVEPVPVAPRDRGRDMSRRIALVMLLVALIVSVAWVARQGQRRSALPAPLVPVAGGAPRAGQAPVLRPSVPPSVEPVSDRPAPVVSGSAATVPAAAPAATASHPGPEIVPTKPLEGARQALSSGNPDEAIALLRTTPPSTDPAVKSLLIEALAASGAKAVSGYHWQVVARRAREALALAEPGMNTHGAHGLLGDALVAFNDLEGAVAEFQRALAETPRDARMRRHLLRARLQLQARTKDGSGASSSASRQPAAE